MSNASSYKETPNPSNQHDEIIRTDPDDCMPCRVTGAAAFIGLGTYSYFSGHSQLKAQQAAILRSKSIFGIKSRQAGITSIALALVGAGVYRLVN
ncbi:hypothetical protein GLAREA_07196 [Glarea lozoyensis ATCC 20868]|uniref:Distal membrane-arm assembly complex protein 1-like domain-containing protein n=1 Tax=Glarea lozoyensis (strain ATCC 20868 / MF5171) TaxID=1116229 RepID=S3E777_GLAL2|nr:uncharacterized protein GLAREA_07196 [Glarea lozoyensis ATCC 20868]EPE34183.1 hypothetical protein GLAREA_07196 [Glarea lozoyensis ATCC 20868]